MSTKRNGHQVKKRPAAYPVLPQHLKFREALEFCEIRKGITKAQLMDRMKNCIPDFYRRERENGRQS